VDDQAYESTLRDQVLQSVNEPEPTWIDEFMLTKEEFDAIADPEFIVQGLIVKGHVIVIAAAPGAGKTTIFFHLAGRMAANGLKVIYVNADVSAGDAKYYHEKATKQGINLLLPDMKVGTSMNDVVNAIASQNNQGADLSNTVFIFDTLKKMADVIQKGSIKRLLLLMRSLSAKGATIILLAHTNKFAGADGRPVFEGTGDLRADVDELIYLIPQKNSDGSMTVSVEPDKTRADIESMSFSISASRHVERLSEFVDVAAQTKRLTALEADQEAIERVTEALTAGKYKHAEIIEYCTEHGLTRRKLTTVLSKYSKGLDQKWRMEKGFQYNSKNYYLMGKTSV
jgi:hypothetical protein